MAGGRGAAAGGQQPVRAEPNVDLGLAALVQACGFRPGSGETVFALSRMVGWLAHAMEEYPQGLRFRPRAVYTGESRESG